MDFLQKIIRWGEEEDAIKVLLLQGSRAGNAGFDQFSDYDIAIFCTEPSVFTDTENWLPQIGDVWVCVKEKIYVGNKTFHTRLVIFSGGTKVDFSFLPLQVLNEMKDHLPEDYDRGYQVLLDKENFTKGLRKPSFKRPPAVSPSEQEYLRINDEFWFEAYHVAIYLKRNDLWLVKFRANAMHEFLLQMIQWHAEAQKDWKEKSEPLGKNMKLWVDSATWNDLQKVFAHFDVQDSWRALFSSLDLFRRLSVDVARHLGYDYPIAIDKNMSEFIVTLSESS